jgi:phage shock protein A
MESLLALAKSKEVTVKTIKSLEDLEGVSDSDIGRLRDSIRSRLDRADAYSELYADRLDNQMDDALGRAEVDLQLEERKRRLGLSEPSPVVEDEAEEEAEASIE